MGSNPSGRTIQTKENKEFKGYLRVDLKMAFLVPVAVPRDWRRVLSVPATTGGEVKAWQERVKGVYERPPGFGGSTPSPKENGIGRKPVGAPMQSPCTKSGRQTPDAS